jgi:ADP-ribose pyrophosphatase
MIADPKTLSTETVYSGRLFNIEAHELEMASGVRARREILKHPGAVCMVPVDAEGHILLVTQYRHAAGQRLLELPAGTLEPGEDPRDTAARELQEEIGQRATRIEGLGGFYVAPGYTSEYIHLYICTELSASKLQGDDDEDIEIERKTLAEALVAIERGAICDAKSIVGILRYSRMQAAII